MMCVAALSGCQVVSETVFDVSGDGGWSGEVTVRASDEAAEWVKNRPGEAARALSRALSLEGDQVESRLRDGAVEMRASLDPGAVGSVTGEYLGFERVTVENLGETLSVEIKTTTPHALRNALADGAAASGDPDGVSRTMWRLWEIQLKVVCPGDVKSALIKTERGEIPVEFDGREVIYESSLADAGVAVLRTTCEKSQGGGRWWIYLGGVSLVVAALLDRGRRNKTRLSTRG
jgi:hypothetical protein